MPTPMHRHVHKRFQETFGKPDNTLGGDDHWSLKADESKLNINLLVNGTAETPAVWVFDPNNKLDGVLREAIESKDQLEDMIEKIQQRLKEDVHAD